MPKKSNLAERMETVAEKAVPQPQPQPSPIKEVVEAPKPELVESPLEKARRVRAENRNPNESKRDKLLRLAQSRVTRACRDIALVGNLATYKPSALEIAKIEQALGESCAACMNRLNGTRRDSFTFTLS